jgi:hypothetical protein
MPLQLNTFPPNGGTLAFGTIPVAGSSTLGIDFAVSGGINHIDEVTWTWTITGPNAADFTPNPHSDTTVQAEPMTENLTFSPTTPGAKTATLTITSTDAFNTPIVINLTGTAAAGGFLTLSPQTTNDFGMVKDGTDSSVLNVLVQNNSDTDVIVTAIAFNGDFSAGGALPGLPFTQHANHVDAAKVIPIKFHPTSTGFKITANAVEVTSNATNNPTDQAMQGTGVIIFPAFTIADTPHRLLLGYVDAVTPTILEADPVDLDTEESGFIKAVYDYDLPLYEKYLNRHVLRAEDLGTFAYAVTMTTPRQTLTDNLSGQGGLADESIADYYADLGLSADLITVTVSRAADDGPLSITQVFHEVERRGETVERT